MVKINGTRNWGARLIDTRRWLDRVVHDVKLGLETLNRVQFDRPWERQNAGR